ncbi:MAG: hypothetical protein NC211_08870 [Alistipes senegalensis]|nr:hypothetical protein [Oxalobacter formigenes]MCM1281919.1 hypothetical protein [Alistipes senegalensis]
MIWLLLFLSIVVLVLFVAYKLLCLVLFIGAVLLAGGGVVLLGLCGLGFLAGTAGFLVSCHFIQSVPVAVFAAVLTGLAFLFFAGSQVVREARKLISLGQELRQRFRVKQHE